jgi:hypothetical protein
LPISVSIVSWCVRSPQCHSERGLEGDLYCAEQQFRIVATS